MPDSNGLKEEALRFFAERFGVARSALEELTFIERRDEVWACRSLPPDGIRPERPPGLRALRRQAGGFKPTSVFLSLLGPRILSSRIDLDADALRRLALGQRLPWPDDQNEGHVALCFQGDVLGCGRVHAGLLHALLPTGRRRELLGALDNAPRG